MFVSQNNVTKSSLIQFANGEKILSDIVVGRLQKEGVIKYDRCNDLKIKYQIS